MLRGEYLIRTSVTFNGIVLTDPAPKEWKLTAISCADEDTLTFDSDENKVEPDSIMLTVQIPAGVAESFTFIQSNEVTRS